MTFPKSARLLRSADFRRVYDNGSRHTCRWFTAFCLREPSLAETRFGFTLPRAVGKAHVRNRIKRRIRELVRLTRPEFPAGWSIVINPRRAAEDAPVESLRAELERLAARCKQ